MLVDEDDTSISDEDDSGDESSSDEEIKETWSYESIREEDVHSSDEEVSPSNIIIRRSKRLKEVNEEKKRSSRKHSRYDLRPRITNTERFGSMMYQFINQAVKEHVAEGQHIRKKRKTTPASNAMLPEPPYAPTSLVKLIELIEMSCKTPFKDYQELPQLLEPLHEIQKLIGMNKVKLEIVDHVITFAQNKFFHKSEFDHMVIFGPPGCGKTTLSQSLAKLFNRMGKIETDKVVVGNRQNMIGSYLGHTAKATQAVIDRALGGVLLIDEAYSLSDGRSSESGDSFSKACIDTINQNLTEKGGEFICIIVGYKEQLKRDFFGVNEGLQRRFRWWLELQKYKPSELALIFQKMIKDQNLQFDEKCVSNHTAFFESHYTKFPDHAGSVREFVDKVKVAHCRRVFGKDIKGNICTDDMKEAIKLFDKNVNDYTPPLSMYT